MVRFRFIKLLLFSITVSLLSSACSSVSSMRKSSEDEIPYEVAKNYFLKNDVTGQSPTVITTSEEFKKYFGQAPVMGKGGLPTGIDFDKQCVICVVLPATDVSTEISIQSLIETQSHDIVVRYATTTGDKQSYTIQPVSLLIVDKKYDRPVILKKQ